MTSTDILITINGQEFRVEGSTLKPSNTNERSEILKRLDKIDSRLDNLETRLDNVETRLDNVETRLDNVENEQQAQREALRIIGTEQRVLTQKVDDMQLSVYWVLGAIGIFLAAMVLPSYRKKESPEPKKDDGVNLSMRQYTELMLRATQKGENIT